MWFATVISRARNFTYRCFGDTCFKGLFCHLKERFYQVFSFSFFPLLSSHNGRLKQSMNDGREMVERDRSEKVG